MANERSHSLLGMLQRFDGADPTHRWSEFRNRLLVAVDPALDDRGKIRVLMCLLKGEALLFFDSNPHFRDCSFDEILAAFDARYNVPEAQVHIQLTSLVQAPTESVASFAARIRVATNALHPARPTERVIAKNEDGSVIRDDNGAVRMIPNPAYERELGMYEGKLSAIQQLQITHFIKGLSPSIASALPHHRFTKWSDLLASAIAVEEKLAALEHTYLSAHVAAVSQYASVPVPQPAAAPPAAAAAVPSLPEEKIDALCAALSQVTQYLDHFNAAATVAKHDNPPKHAACRPENTHSERPRSRSVKCYRCNKVGHIQRECRVRLGHIQRECRVRLPDHHSKSSLAEDLTKAITDAVSSALAAALEQRSSSYRRSSSPECDSHDSGRDF